LHLTFHQLKVFPFVSDSTSALLIGCIFPLAFHKIKHLRIGIDNVLGGRINQYDTVGYQVQGTSECFSKLKSVDW